MTQVNRETRSKAAHDDLRVCRSAPNSCVGFTQVDACSDIAAAVAVKTQIELPAGMMLDGPSAVAAAAVGGGEEVSVSSMRTALYALA